MRKNPSRIPRRRAVCVALCLAVAGACSSSDTTPPTAEVLSPSSGTRQSRAIEAQSAALTTAREGWRPSSRGLDAAHVYDIAVDPWHSSTVYAATNSGAYESNDGARSWHSLHPAFDGLYVAAVEVDPIRPGWLYVATARGIYRSRDGGRHFEPPSASFDSRSRIQIARSDPNHLYSLEGRVWSSTDAGATWQTTDPPDPSFIGCAVDAADANTVYTVTVSGQVWKSTDGGRTFVPKSEGLPSTPYNGATIATDPERPGVVLVAIDGGGVFRSVDGGESWQTANADTGSRFPPTFAHDPSDPDHVYLSFYSFALVPDDDFVPVRAGLLESMDGGASWHAGAALGIITTLVLAPSDSDRAYFAGSSGLFRSSDGLRTAQPAMVGMHDISVQGLVADARWPGLVYALTGEGLYVSRNGGVRWRRDGPTTDDHIPGLVTAPSRAGVAYLASDPGFRYFTTEADPYVFQTERRPVRLFATSDGGLSWRELTSPGSYSVLRPLAVSPIDPRTFYVYFNGPLSAAGTPFGGVGLLVSEDEGQSFRRLPAPGGCCTALTMVSANHAYGVDDIDGRLYETVDGGQTWTELPLDMPIRTLMIDPRDPQTLYAGNTTYSDPPTPRGLRRSSDGGRTWSTPNQSFETTGATVLGVSPADGRLYVNVPNQYTSAPYGLFVSADRGRTFARAHAGLDANYVLGFLPHPSLPCRAYAGTGAGVYITDSAGGTCP